MKAFLLYSVISLLFLSTSFAQNADLNCKKSDEAISQKISDQFVEDYVKAFGFPEAGGYKARIDYLKKEISKTPDCSCADPKLQGLKDQLNQTEIAANSFAQLDTAAQHRAYVENEVQRRVSYLKGYLQKRGCSLSDLDVFVISLYTGSQYKLINTALRSGGDVLAKYRFLVDAINDGLGKLTPYTGEVRRGVSLAPEIAKQYCLGCEVEEKAFVSATTGNVYAKQPYQFIIKSKTGVYIAPISSAPMEEEVLFKSGTYFKVTKVKGHLITMEEMP